MFKKLVSVLLVLSMSAALLAGCGSKDEQPSKVTVVEKDEPGAAGDQNAEADKPAVATGFRSYTTGEPVSEEQSKQRVVGIMIENSYSAQPGYGTSQADVIYEFQAEGGISRMLALYTDTSGMDRWGNVRSAREYFCYTALAWDAIYIHFGGAIEAYKEIFDLGLMDDIDLMSGDNSYSFRSSDKSAPHNAYTTSTDIAKSIKSHGYRTTVAKDFDGYFNFNTDDAKEITLDDGEDAEVVVAFQADPEPYFIYHPEDGLYYRYEFGSEHYDKYFDKQLAFKNIIIQITSVSSYFSDIDGHDRVDIGIVGSGNGYYATNGKIIPIFWKCSGKGEVTHYYDAAGNEITLNQGKTNVCVCDDDDASRCGGFTLKEFKK